MSEPVNLDSFCAVQPGRYDLSKPFVDSGFLYFTDGRRAARIPTPDVALAIEGLSIRPPANCHKLVQAHVDTATTWSSEPLPYQKPDGCNLCGATGKLELCGWCDGSGEVLGEDDYEHECGRCDGNGHVPHGASNLHHDRARYDACYRCDGTGAKSTFVKFGPMGYDARFLNAIRDFANLEWSIGTAGSLVWRCAGGCEGIVLPFDEEARK